MMKLSDTFTSRIVIDKSKTDADCVDACMLFLKTLELDPESEKTITELTEVSRILESSSPSEIDRKRMTFFYSKVVPFMRSIAPGNCYFGRHPEDGNLLGFWEKSLLL
jgi:hypothetical protein